MSANQKDNEYQSKIVLDNKNRVNYSPWDQQETVYKNGVSLLKNETVTAFSKINSTSRSIPGKRNLNWSPK